VACVEGSSDRRARAFTHWGGSRGRALFRRIPNRTVDGRGSRAASRNLSIKSQCGAKDLCSRSATDRIMVRPRSEAPVRSAKWSIFRFVAAFTGVTRTRRESSRVPEVGASKIDECPLCRLQLPETWCSSRTARRSTAGQTRSDPMFWPPARQGRCCSLCSARWCAQLGCRCGRRRCCMCSKGSVSRSKRLARVSPEVRPPAGSTGRSMGAKFGGCSPKPGWRSSMRSAVVLTR
jgi:hypothetical protein